MGGPDENVARRIPRSAHRRKTKQNYIKPFDPAAGDGMEWLPSAAELLRQSPIIVQRAPSRPRAKLLIENRGEMAEWPKAAVC